MKTAIQELIDEVVEHLTYDDGLSEDGRVVYETIRLRLIGKLEKEKFQIADAFYSGDKDRDLFIHNHNYYHYYDKTYNGNKQTTVQWLAEQMLHPEIHNPYIEQAKQMEREGMVGFHKWMVKNDTMENAERFFHYTDEDMLNEYLKETK